MEHNYRIKRNLVGERFGSLVVVKWVTKIGKDGKGRWQCLCDCGNTTHVTTGSLRNNNTRSCGCKKDLGTHRMSNTPTYITWQSMKTRCKGKSEDKKRVYKDRGITVCDRWQNSFENFFADMGERPVGKTLDRIDNNKGYYAENCRWATPQEQSHNSRCYILTEEMQSTIKEMLKTKTKAQVMRELNIGFMTVHRATLNN